MTESDLSKYYISKKEAEQLANKLEEMGDGVASVKIKEVVSSGGGGHDSIEERIAELKDLYYERRLSALEECVKIERYINSIDDPEMRMLLRYRFLDLYTWEDIASRTYQERTTVAKKVRRFLKEENDESKRFVRGFRV